MSLVDTAVHLFAVAVVVGCVGRASSQLLRDPEESHEELVSTRERRVTTAVGVPLTLVGLSSMVDGPLAVPLDPLLISISGIVLLVYPDFSPSAL
ncbi:hypothetical protein [Halosimplex sp. J119]